MAIRVGGRNTWFVAVLAYLLGSMSTVLAVPIVNDPNGFEDLPWGTIWSQSERFVKIDDTGRIRTYEPNGYTPKLGTTVVDSIRFTTFENKFGRVMIRYSGNETHEHILDYLQSLYGPLDRTPGQIAVGSVKVYAWHGVHTEVTLRFESGLARGIIFFESRTLPEKLVDDISPTAF
ncbi:MAG: hypothetical protein AB7J53_06135 [Nitrospira sp.]